MTKPNRRTLRLAQLLEADAPMIQAAYDWLDAQTTPNPWPSATIGDGSRATTPTSAVERETLRQDYVREQRHMLTELLNAIDGCRRDALDYAASILRTAPDVVDTRQRCEAPDGLAGKNVPLDEGGWFDPLCTNYSRSRKGGLCNRCRVACDRWRTLNEMPDLDDERTIEHDSDTYVGRDGVAHTRPLITGAA